MKVNIGLLTQENNFNVTFAFYYNQTKNKIEMQKVRIENMEIIEKYGLEKTGKRYFIMPKHLKAAELLMFHPKTMKKTSKVNHWYTEDNRIFHYIGNSKKKNKLYLFQCYHRSLEQRNQTVYYAVDLKIGKCYQFINGGIVDMDTM
jgi:hypothetical protein